MRIIYKTLNDINAGKDTENCLGETSYLADNNIAEIKMLLFFIYYFA